VLTADDRAALAELVPALRRAVRLDERALARLRLGPQTATVLVRLPFGVLVSRTVRRESDVPRSPAAPEREVPAGPDLPAAGSGVTPAGSGSATADMTLRAADVLAWFDAPQVTQPVARDAEWRSGRPPEAGWRRIDTVPDDVVRGLVRQGASAVEAAAAREGVPGAQPRAAVTDALLDATVLTVSSEDGTQAEVTLRALSALLRMGFAPRGGHVHVDVAGRWIRVVAGYGTVYLERAGQQLTLR
jgi:hypothetical protein